MPITPNSTVSRAVTRKPNDIPDKVRPKQRGNGGLTRKVRTAIEAQVFEGETRAEAAKSAGLCENALYQALRKPAVLTYWNECLKVLRTGERARNIHRLTEIRDADDNMPAVNAIKALEQMVESDAAQPRATVTTPGIVIIVGGGQLTGDQMQSAPKPLIEQRSVPVCDGERDD